MSRLADVLLQGTHAARPAAASGNQAYLYYETDTQILFQSTGSAWTQIAAAASLTPGGVVANAGGAPSLQVGVDASKPAAGTAGRLYVATDTGNLYEDSGSAWGVVATVQWANLTGKPSTFAPSAHESSHLAGGSDPLAAVAQTQIDVDSAEASTNDSLSGGNLRTNMRRIRYQLAQLGTGAWNTLVAMVQLSPGSQQSGTINVDGQIQGADFKPGGLTGATAVSRYVGATASGAPASGTFAVGDVAVDQSGTFYICTTAGTPGTWTQVKGNPTFSGEVTGSDFKPSGLTGATAAVRFVGGTASAAPTTGTFAVGDFVITQAGSIFICTTAGTPGTWTQVSGGGGGSSTLAGDTDVSISSPVGGQVLGYSDALSKWVNQQVAGVAATTSTAQLGADVTMTSADTYYDGPSVTVAPGTWLLIGALDFVAAGNDISAKLWDGTTVFASGGGARNSGGASGNETVTLSAIVTPTTTTTYKISGASDGAGDKIKAALVTNGAGNNASFLQAIQLSGNPVGQQAPAVRCYNSANISIPHGTITALTFDSNRYDQGTSTPQHSTSSNTSRLVCQQAGVYQITGLIRFAISGAASTTTRLALLRLNGSTEIGRSSPGGANDSVNDVHACVTAQYQLNIGDYVELCAYQDSGGALNVEHQTNYSPEFMMARIDTGGTGAVYVPVVKVANYTILPTDSMVVAGANGLTLTLPAASAYTGKPPLVIKNDNFTATTIARAGSDTIDGATSYSLPSAYQSISLVSDSASEWRIV